MENFTPSPAKVVKVIDDKGQVVKTINLNRAQRRKMKIGRR